MSGDWKTALLALCVLCVPACIDAFDPESSGLPEAQVPTTLILSRDSVSVLEYDQFQLLSELRDQHGKTMILQPTASYSSSVPEVAKVTAGGFVTALVPGRTVITARTTLGQIPLTDSIIVIVSKVTLRTRPVLDALTNGWSPNVVRILAGDEVEWHAGFIATSGRPVTSVWLWKNQNSLDYDEVNFAGGVARRTFASPGTYTYCSGGCWDPPEFGTIIVE